MDALDAIHRRRSIPKLVEPGPTDDELAILLEAAAAAPDHGKLHPWRFVVLKQAGKDAFGEVFAEAYRASCAGQGVEPSDNKIDTERAKLKRAPVVIVAIHKAIPNSRIRLDEQRNAVAAAVQNLLIAATASGFGSMWRTGGAKDDPTVRAALGLGESDSIVGFIYVGTTPADFVPRRAPGEPDVPIELWQPPN